MTIEFDELQVDDEGRGSGRTKRRIVAGVAAAMLIAGAGGVGYGIGRGVERDTPSADDSASGAPETDDEGDRAAAPSTTSAATEEPSSTLAPATDALAEGTSDGVAEPAPAGDAGLRASGGIGYPAFGTQPMETLYERTTDNGFVVRVQLGQTWDTGQGDWGAGDWRPAPWCFESGQMRVSLVGNGIVDVGGVPWYAEPFRGRAVSWVLLGGNDAAPQWVIVAQTPADVTNVRAAFADGSTDQTAPQGGIAVLTAPGEPATEVSERGYSYWMDPTPSFEVTFEGGAEPITIDSAVAGPWDDPAFRESCTPPPPALPDPGEQPADPGAADAEIRAAMAALYGEFGDGVERTDFIDDPTGVAEAREQVQAGVYADDASSALATIDELVFTSPDEAWFRYSIDTPGNDFDNRYGIAVTVDGVWKITRATICQDLSLAGGDCGGGWEPIYPLGS
jgi:hypothetical protein